MTERKRGWTVRLAAAAASDFEHIIDGTIEHFGEPQVLAYAETLSLAIEASPMAHPWPALGSAMRSCI